MRHTLLLVLALSVACAHQSGVTSTSATPAAQPVVKIDTVEVRFPDGKPMERYEFYTRKNGDKVKHGLYRMWNEEGVKILECQYVKGNRQGPYRTWFANGRPEIVAKYDNDAPSGTLSSWYDSGAQQSEETYKNGVKEGPSVLYYDNGKMKFQGSFANGRQHGVYWRYFPNGQLEAKGEYDNGALKYETKDFKK